MLEFKVKAASTVGSFLRGCDAGNVKQLGDVVREASRRVHEHIDDNTEPVCLDVGRFGGVLGEKKPGAAVDYTAVVGVSPYGRGALRYR